MYALGWTHHSFSVQLIHTAAMLQLLLGNIGMAGGGINALRGHSNIQGGTDCGMAYHNLPGYIAIPKQDHPDLKTFLEAVTAQAAASGVDELLGQHRPVLRQPDEGLLRQEGDQGKRVRLPVASAAARRAPPRAPTKTGVGPSSSTTCTTARWTACFSFGMNPVNNGPHSRKVITALTQAEVAGGGGKLRDRDGVVLEAGDHGAGRGQDQDRRRQDRGLPPARRQLRREGRLLRQFRPLVPVEVQGGGSARRRQDRPGDHRPHLPQGSRAVPPRKAARRPSLSSTSTGGTPTRFSLRSTKWRKRDQRLGAHRGQGREGPEDGCAQARRAVGEVPRRSAPTGPPQRQLAVYRFLYRRPAISASAATTPIPAA